MPLSRTNAIVSKISAIVTIVVQCFSMDVSLHAEMLLPQHLAIVAVEEHEAGLMGHQ